LVATNKKASLGSMKLRRHWSLWAWLALVGVGGCADSGGAGIKLFSGKRETAPASDIIRVVCFYTPNMWRSFDKAGNLDPEGFAFVMYLWSGKTERGAYADGLFRAKMYRLSRDDEGKTVRELAREWTAATSDLPRRGESRLGYSYQPSLYWGDLDIYGAEVEIVIQFESPDERVVQSQTHRTKVPRRKG
jgi:hypothetical protein